MVCGGVVGEVGRPKLVKRPRGSPLSGDPGLWVRRLTG